MSQQETVTGKLKLIPKLPNETLEDQCKRICNDKGYFLEEPYDLENYSYLEYLQDEFYGKYVDYKGDLYEVIQKKDLDDLSIFNISKNQDGTFDFTLSYYNGGCCFSEAIGYAFEDMEEN